MLSHSCNYIGSKLHQTINMTYDGRPHIMRNSRALKKIKLKIFNVTIRNLHRTIFVALHIEL
jgi:hypothetical protein